MVIDSFELDFLWFALYALEPVLKLVMGSLLLAAFMESYVHIIQVLRG